MRDFLTVPALVHDIEEKADLVLIKTLAFTSFTFLTLPSKPLVLLLVLTSFTSLARPTLARLSDKNVVSFQEL